jgi:hypothetical protein
MSFWYDYDESPTLEERREMDKLDTVKHIYERFLENMR